MQIFFFPLVEMVYLFKNFLNSTITIHDHVNVSDPEQEQNSTNCDYYDDDATKFVLSVLC